MDAMSDAIEGADVMLYGVSLRYKESANVSQAAACMVTVRTEPVRVWLTHCICAAIWQCRMVRIGRDAFAAQLSVVLMRVLRCSVQPSAANRHAHSHTSPLCPRLRRQTTAINRSWT